jgi:hypothetical protein
MSKEQSGIQVLRVKTYLLGGGLKFSLFSALTMISGILGVTHCVFVDSGQHPMHKDATHTQPV